MEPNQIAIAESSVQAGMFEDIAHGAISVSSSKERRSQSLGGGPFKSLSSIEGDNLYQLLTENATNVVGDMQEKLALCLNQQDQFKNVVNELVCQAKESITSLSLGLSQQQKMVDVQQDK